MFQVGDKIAYPMHGAGVIRGIKEEEVHGETVKYYDVDLPHSEMKILVPVDKCENVGLRHIISEDLIDGVLDVLSAESEPMDSAWNRRFRENTDKLHTGDIHIIAGVVRDLRRNDKVKRLSMGERKLLNSAKQILESELALASGKTIEEIDETVEARI